MKRCSGNLNVGLSDSEAIDLSSAQCRFGQSIWNYLHNFLERGGMYKKVDYRFFDSSYWEE